MDTIAPSPAANPSLAAANAARLTVLHVPVYLRVRDTDVPRILTKLPWPGGRAGWLCEAGGETVCCSRVTSVGLF